MHTRTNPPRATTRICCALAAAGLLLMSARTIDAHHAIAMFDIDTAVTIKGRLLRAEINAPHSFLYVEQETPDGPIEWAIEGPAPNQLLRRGIANDAFAAGDAIEACGYVLREGASEAYRGRRVLVAEVLVMADGQARLWSPYGQERCRDQNVYDIAQ